jgi:hypothetical protein
MNADTAERLAEQALRISDELNELVRDIRQTEPDSEFVRLRAAIGRVMWAVYYEILKPTVEEHPSVESEARAEARAAAKLGAATGRRQARGSAR